MAKLQVVKANMAQNWRTGLIVRDDLYSLHSTEARWLILIDDFYLQHLYCQGLSMYVQNSQPIPEPASSAPGICIGFPNLRDKILSWFRHIRYSNVQNSQTHIQTPEPDVFIATVLMDVTWKD